MESDRPIAKPQ